MNDSLYSKIYAWDNLLLAYRKAAKGKRSKVPVADFEYRLEDNLVTLRQELQAQSYRPGPYHSLFIHDPKRRLISTAPFRDRVVHHALCNVIEPLFERSFIDDSYANRLGKGNQQSNPPSPTFVKVGSAFSKQAITLFSNRSILWNL